jgi:hypothetical protein
MLLDEDAVRCVSFEVRIQTFFGRDLWFSYYPQRR